ncbi:MAG: DUF4124 domain-containing protein [Chromatiales bacterium]|nr:DUF4124 domain-containing protein [Chromatiales bacterium]
MDKTHLPPLFIALALLAFPAMGQVYKWTDASGRIHYGDRPADQTAKAMRLPPSTSGLSATAGQPDAQLQRFLQARKEERDIKTQERKESVMEGKSREELCDRAKIDLRLLEEQPRLIIRDKSGEERLLSDEERAEQKDLVVEEIARFCEDTSS